MRKGRTHLVITDLEKGILLRKDMGKKRRSTSLHKLFSLQFRWMRWLGYQCLVVSGHLHTIFSQIPSHFLCFYSFHDWFYNNSNYIQLKYKIVATCIYSVGCGTFLGELQNRLPVWTSVADGGPTLNQHCFNVSCLLGLLWIHSIIKKLDKINGGIVKSHFSNFEDFPWWVSNSMNFQAWKR